MLRAASFGPLEMSLATLLGPHARLLRRARSTSTTQTAKWSQLLACAISQRHSLGSSTPPSAVPPRLATARTAREIHARSHVRIRTPR
eukprot:365609-Pyramimonas_sp.AAC.1